MTPQEKLAALGVFIEQMDMLHEDFYRYSEGHKDYPFAVVRESVTAALNQYAEVRALLSEHGGGGEAAAYISVGGGALDFVRHYPDDRPLVYGDSIYTSPPAPSAPVEVEERVRGVIALLRKAEPDNGENYTEHDAGYDQASREIADMLERALTPPAAAPTSK